MKLSFSGHSFQQRQSKTLYIFPVLSYLVGFRNITANSLLPGEEQDFQIKIHTKYKCFFNQVYYEVRKPAFIQIVVSAVFFCLSCYLKILFHLNLLCRFSRFLSYSVWHYNQRRSIVDAASLPLGCVLKWMMRYSNPSASSG